MDKFWATTSRPEVEIRKDSDGAPLLVGYAATFGHQSHDLGGFVETIHATAFNESLAENPDVSARVQHQGGLSTIGRTTNGTLKLSVDKKGLRYEVKPPNTGAGRDIVELIRRGDIDKSSFAFSLRGDKGDSWDFSVEPPVRTLLNVNLFDIAPVDGPAYESTSVNVRALEAARASAKTTVVPAPPPQKAESLDHARERIAEFKKYLSDLGK